MVKIISVYIAIVIVIINHCKFIIVRGEGDIKVGIDEIVKFVTDITKIHLYDELLLKVDMIESFGDYNILYMRYKG